MLFRAPQTALYKNHICQCEVIKTVSLVKTLWVDCVNSWCEFCSQRVVSQLGTQLTSVSLTALLKQKAIMLKTLLQPWSVVT